MITLIVFCLIGYVIYKAFSNPADKKSKKQIALDADKKANLPDIYLKGKRLGSWEKAANLFPGDRDILDIFQYRSSDRSVYLKMLDGRSITCPLSQLDVTFDKATIYRFVIRHNKTSFSFYQFDYVFKKEEYDVIIGVLLLAGTTHNRGIMGSTYKNTAKAATIIKILSKL